jgi:hypothetical protein
MLLRLSTALAAAAACVLVPLSSPAAARTCAPPPPVGATSALHEAAPATPLVSTQTSIHWTRASTRVTYGETALLEGQVVTEDGALTGTDVDLFARDSDDQEWIPVDSTTSDADTGVFTFGCLFPEGTTTYRVVYGGTLRYASSEGTREVLVTRWLPDSLQQVSPYRFVFAGSVEPRYDGRVTLQRRACRSCAWERVAVDETDARSGWRFRIDVSRLRRGVYGYRAVIVADDRFARSRSDRVWRIRVR